MAMSTKKRRYSDGWRPAGSGWKTAGERCEREEEIEIAVRLRV
jgi:hypothetical protein